MAKNTKDEAPKAQKPAKAEPTVTRKGNVVTTKLPNGSVLVNSVAEEAAK